jgi:phenylacetate-CoA ligase
MDARLVGEQASGGELREANGWIPRRPTARPWPDDTYARLYQTVLWPTWERVVRGRTTHEILARLERNQWLPRDEVESAQVEALRQLLTHAGTHVPYYREVFRRIGFDPKAITSTKDLEALPLLTRDIVRERYADLVSEGFVGKSIPKGTSGSTGAPLKFEYSAESECWRQATRIRGYSWAGYRPGLPVFYYWGAVSALSRGPKGLKVRLDRAMKRETFVDSMKQDERSRVAALDSLRRTKPKVIVCYTQSCAQFARWILDRGARDWDDVPVLCGAEAVLEADRSVLSRAFGPVFETYGSRETMLVAAECDAHDGMHLSEENLLVEITAGSRGAEGAGDVTITDLHNYRMPFIRYVNGDVAAFSRDRDACRCGRTLRRIARVEGRRADTLIDKEGTPVPGIVFHVLLSDARKEVLRQFQAVQRPDGQVVLKVVRGREWSPDAFDAIRARLGEYLRGLPLEIEFHEAIPPSPNGKMRTIVVERRVAVPPAAATTPTTT